MPKKTPKNPADYIMPLNINGLEGRMLHLPPPRNHPNTELLFVYGHHSTIERWWGLIQVLNHYGSVTVPDLPGFGGMDSFYSIGKKPSLDNMADYLAAFVKLRYKRKKIVIAGMSFGFVVATRMLQRYPELIKKVVLLVSIVGFAHKDDFTFSTLRRDSYLTGTRVMGYPFSAKFFRYTALNTLFLRAFYSHTHNAKHKFEMANSTEEYKYLMDFEIGLWHKNDVRTWLYTTNELLRLDNCTVRVALPVWHIGTKNDHFFDNNLVEQHMRVIFSDFHEAPTILSNHAPSVIADEKMAAPLVPQKIRRVLAKLG